MLQPRVSNQLPSLRDIIPKGTVFERNGAERVKVSKIEGDGIMIGG